MRKIEFVFCFFFSLKSSSEKFVAVSNEIREQKCDRFDKNRECDNE